MAALLQLVGTCSSESLVDSVGGTTSVVSPLGQAGPAKCIVRLQQLVVQRSEGERGNDWLSTPDGNDILRGGYGDDVFHPSGGDDAIYVGEGIDKVEFLVVTGSSLSKCHRDLGLGPQ
jgi:hypothetical protein